MSKIIPTGYYLVHRAIFNHWLWERRKLSKWEAWQWLIAVVNIEDKPWFDGKEDVKVGRGETIISLNGLCLEWQWKVHEVRSLLNKLTVTQMIRTQTNTRYTKVTICNYDTYQNVKQTKGKPLANKLTHEPQQLKEVINKDSKVTPTPFDELFEKWIVYRKELKKPILDVSIEAAKKKLIKMSGGDLKVAEEIIENSIANGYQGLIELKNGTLKFPNGNQQTKVPEPYNEKKHG
jgi:hypothetical protein